MMITVAAAFSTAITQEKVRIAELYILTLRDGTVYRYTTHIQDIVWDATPHTYSSLPRIERSDIGRKANLESDSVTIRVSNITGPLYSSLQGNALDGAILTIKRVLWDQPYASSMEITLFIGTVNVEFNRSILELSCRSILDTLNIQVPKCLFQEPCNNSLFDAVCSLTQATYAYSRTATGGTLNTLIDTTRGIVYKSNFDAGDSANPIAIGNTITGQIGFGTAKIIQVVYTTSSCGTVWYVEQSGLQFVNNEVLRNATAKVVTVNGTPGEDIHFYELGELEITSGDNLGQRRPILSNLSNTVTVMWPFSYTIVAGITYKLYPGCDKRVETCAIRFGNSANYNGYLFVPKIEETLM